MKRGFGISGSGCGFEEVGGCVDRDGKVDVEVDVGMTST